MPLSREQLDELFSESYEELRRLASRVKQDDPAQTLSPTALVNEAWLRLAASPPARAVSALHFRRIAARAMRQVLVEAARRRQAQKRGGGAAFVTFDESLAAPPASSDELLALNAALEDFARVHPRQASVVELRFFGGLGLPEIARALEVSEPTIDRDWRSAKAWLARQLVPPEPEPT